MALSSTSRTSSPKWLLPASMSPGKSQLSPASLGCFPRSASGSNPGSFQITASALGLGVCEILHMPFKSRVSVSYNLIALHGCKPPLAFKASHSGGSSSQCRTPWAGVLTPCFLGRTSAVLIILSFVNRLPRSVGLDYTLSLPLLPIQVWFLHYIFSCGKSFLLVFRLFSQIVAL